MKKVLKIASVLMILAAMSSNVFAASEKGVYYSEDFNNATSFESLENWGLEFQEKTVEGGVTAPTIENGVLKFDSYDTVIFKWKDVAGVGEYDVTKTYSIQFDIKVTNMGDGSHWKDASEAHTRCLYAAPGGWFNQIELPTGDNKVRAGDTYVDLDDATFIDKVCHVKLTTNDDTITTTISDSNGEVIAEGFRTSASYTDMEGRNEAMTYWVFRCEDGAFEMDNFVFGDSTEIITDPVVESKEDSELSQTEIITDPAVESKEDFELSQADKTPIAPATADTLAISALVAAVTAGCALVMRKKRV